MHYSDNITSFNFGHHWFTIRVEQQLVRSWDSAPLHIWKELREGRTDCVLGAPVSIGGVRGHCACIRHAHAPFLCDVLE
jgi:hypothetical protein